MDGDSEQMFHDLEQRHILLRKEHDVVCIEKEAFKSMSAFRLHNHDDMNSYRLRVSIWVTLARFMMISHTALC